MVVCDEQIHWQATVSLKAPDPSPSLDSRYFFAQVESQEAPTLLQVTLQHSVLISAYPSVASPPLVRDVLH